MTFKKSIMSYNALKKMGFTEAFLNEVIQMPNQKIACKTGTKKQSQWSFDTDELLKYWNRRCSGRR